MCAYIAYKLVIEDVITSMKEQFRESGVDEKVLDQLKELWNTHLHESKAIVTDATATEIAEFKALSENSEVEDPGIAHVQIDLETDSTTKSMMIRIPQIVIDEDRLKVALTGEIISSLRVLSTEIATYTLQEHIYEIFKEDFEQISLNNCLEALS